ncbi:MAG: intermembrane phospholipid transport protein YdbH family protein [Candidatus Azotimanducaceae bacterium WSBS_2022_MAG_OTU7]
MSLLWHNTLPSGFRHATITLIVLLILSMAASYAAAPYLLPLFLSSYLQTLGIEHSEFDLGRPGFRRMVIDRISLTASGAELEAKDLIVRYHFSGLLDQRIDSVTVQRLSIRLPASPSANGSDTLPSPWAAIPVDSLSVLDFQLSTAAPAALFAGRVSLSPSVAEASLRITSDLLPAELETRLQLLPTGELALVVTPPASQPVLSVHGHYDSDGQIKFDADLQLEGAAFELALGLAGIEQPAGFIKGTFTGAAALRSQSAMSVTGTGSFDVDFEGNVAAITGLSYKGPIDVFLEPEHLRVASTGSTVSGQAVEALGGQYLFRDTLVGLTYRAQIPLTDGLPALSLATGEADLSVLINVPGAAQADDALTLHGTSLTGAVTAILDDDLQRLSGTLLVAATQLDYGNTHFELEGEGGSLRLDLDLKAPRAAIVAPSMHVSGTLGADITTVMVSSAADAPFRKLGLEVGVQISAEEGRYQASIVPYSLVNVLAGEQNVEFETLSTILVNLGEDGSISSSGGTLSTRFSFSADDQQLFAYTNAQLNVESLFVGADEFEARGRFKSDSSSDALPVNFIVNGKHTSATGTFEVSTNHFINRQLFKKELPGWVSDYELLAGQFDFLLKGTFDVSDEPRIDAYGHISLGKGIARFDGVSINEIAIGLPVRIENSTLLVGPGPVSFGSADIGFPATEMAFQFETDTARVRLNDFSANVLAANVRIDQLVYDINNESAEFAVEVSGLPIASVLALEGDDIQGDGILDGRLPVIFTKAGARVKGGSFSARPPGGHLRYQGDVPRPAWSLSW